MSEYTMNDAVNYANDGNASEFKNAVDSLLMNKIKDSVEIKRHEVSANFMNDIDLEGSQNEDI